MNKDQLTTALRKHFRSQNPENFTNVEQAYVAQVAIADALQLHRPALSDFDLCPVHGTARYKEVCNKCN